MPVKTHYCVQVTVTDGEYETVLAQLYAHGLQGCEETTDPDGCIQVKAYFNSESTAHRVCVLLRTVTSHSDQITITSVVDQDWNAEWRKSMQPAHLAPSWWVSPHWLPPPREPDDHWIRIEPKMAFGTGHHETTRLAARALIDVSDHVRNAVLLDIGTGSGVLCFTGAMLGAAWCAGVEIDTDCRENLAENRSQNLDAGPCEFIIGSIDALKTTAVFSVIVMNMLYTESAPLLSRCSTALLNQGVLIWSGILDDEHDSAIRAAEKTGFHLATSHVENEWWCGVFNL